MVKLDEVSYNNKELLKSEAIRSLVPKGLFTVRALDLDVEWQSDDLTEPTESEIDAEVIRLQAEYDAQEYSRNRALAYDSVKNQLDQQYWDQVNGTTTWKDAVAKVKSDNPKPE